MPKILCFTTYPEHAPSVYHRIKAYAPYFQHTGLELEIISFMNPTFFARRRTFGWRNQLYKMMMFLFCTLKLIFLIPKAKNAELVIIHREVFPLGPPWVEQLLAYLAPYCVYDLDDAIWFAPSNGVNQRAILHDPHRVEKIMKSVDAVIAGSPFIKDYALKHNNQVLTIPTTYDDHLGSKPAKHQLELKTIDAPTVLWIGNWGNAFYLESILPVIAQLQAKHRFNFVALGGKDVFDLQHPNLSITPIHWSRELEKHWLTHADIGIMPLSNLNYEQGKCAFKLIQYMSAGLPLIATPIGMNKSVVKPNMGYLADDPSQWYSALENLLKDPKHRQQLGANAYKSFQENYSREVGFDLWLKVYHFFYRDPQQMSQEQSTENIFDADKTYPDRKII